MTQIIEKVIEIEGPKAEELELEINEESKVDELIGDLNPRYFEEVYSLEEAKNKAKASTIVPSSNNSFFGGF
ncbi:MAG: hypothetical protein ACFFA3_13810 [Promethearchaeota archaeon]